MKVKDPCDVVCPECSTRHDQAVADLISLRAICKHCGVSLAENGRAMKKSCEEIANQMTYVVLPLMDLEEQLEIPIPDDAIGEGIRTKADLVRAVVSYLAKVAPEKADSEMIARVYDQSLIHAGTVIPASDDTPLF